MRILDTVRVQREFSFSQAAVFAVQAVVCTLLAVGIYAWAGASGGMWAAVSAVLVLQPGVHRALTASVARVIANLLGAGTGIVVGMLFQQRLAAVCVSLVVLVMVCEAARLDVGLRSACASLLIVTLSPEPELLHRGLERALAVSVGCGLALILQLAVNSVRRPDAAPVEAGE